MNLHVTIDKLVLASDSDAALVRDQVQQLGNRLGHQLVTERGLRDQRVSSIQVQSSSGIHQSAHPIFCNSVIRGIRHGGRK